MKFASILSFILLIFSDQIVFAQTEPVPTVFVKKVFVIRTNPPNAEIFLIDENGKEVSSGTDSVEFSEKKSESGLIEVRKEGYVSVRKRYTRQKGGADRDVIELPNRKVKLTVWPQEAEFFTDNVSLGKGTYDLIIPKDRKITVEVKCAGYSGVSRTFSNIPDDEDPGSLYNFTLEDRVVKIIVKPDDAMIFAGNQQAGRGSAEVVVAKNSCVTVYVERTGYVSKSETYCNREKAPVLSDEIHLKDRTAKMDVQPEKAVISIDGKEVGRGPYDLKILDGRCLEVLVQAPGFVPYSKSICNRPGAAQPEVSYSVKLTEDEAYTQTKENTIVNTNFEIAVRPDLLAVDAWKKLCSIIQTYIPETESQDDAASYLRTKWVPSVQFNAATTFPRVVRTRIVLKQGSITPLKFIINVQSELSKTGRDCITEDARTPSVSRDECYDPFPRILRKYSEMFAEIQARVSIGGDIAPEMKTSDLEEPKKPSIQKDNTEPAGNNTDGDYYIARWRCTTSSDIITISKEEGHYLLETQGRKIKMNYKDDALVSTDPSVGKVTFVHAHLVWQDKEYEDVNVPPPADSEK